MSTRTPCSPRGTTYLWPHGALFVGSDLVTVPHSHCVASIVVSLDRPFRARAGGGAFGEHEALFVAPEATKEIDGRGATVAVMLVDPETRSYRSLASRIEASAGHEALTPALSARLRRRARALLDHDPERYWRTVVRVLSHPGSANRTVDTRVEGAMRLIRRRLPDRASLSELATEVGLSEGRLTRLFRREMGFSLGRYTQWQRVREAMIAIAAGGNMTDAALDAGFADSAHLSRTFRCMFGLPPSAVLRSSRSLQLVVRPGMPEEIVAPYQQDDLSRWRDALAAREGASRRRPSTRPPVYFS